MSNKHLITTRRGRSLKKNADATPKWPLFCTQARIKTSVFEAPFWFRTENVSTFFITSRFCDFKCHKNIKSRQGEVDLKKTPTPPQNGRFLTPKPAPKQAIVRLHFDLGQRIGDIFYHDQNLRFIVSNNHSITTRRGRSQNNADATPKWPLFATQTPLKTGDSEAPFWFRTDNVATFLITSRICDFKCQTNIKSWQGEVDLKKTLMRRQNGHLFDAQTHSKNRRLWGSILI